MADMRCRCAGHQARHGAHRTQCGNATGCRPKVACGVHVQAPV